MTTTVTHVSAPRGHPVTAVKTARVLPVYPNLGRDDFACQPRVAEYYCRKSMPRRKDTSRQLGLAARGHGRGGYRDGAGRHAKKPVDRKGHGPRPEHLQRHPVHVTLKTVANGPHLRRGDCFRVLRACFARGKDRFGFRLVHFTVQSNQLHLVCEADDKRALTRGMQGLAIRVARNLNKKLGRRGRLFAERYHARPLQTPTEVRRVLVYVLHNARRHAPGRYTARGWVDPCSSAPWFDGFRHPPREAWARPDGERPVAPPGTWLLRTGWRRAGGPLGLDDRPADDPPRS